MPETYGEYIKQLEEQARLMGVKARVSFEPRTFRIAVPLLRALKVAADEMGLEPRELVNEALFMWLKSKGKLPEIESPPKSKSKPRE